ncbi:MAG: NUDIX domain-containing protein [Qingshengfaniella sp.]
MRRYGDVPRQDKTYRPRPGVYAVLQRGSDVLLTHQNGLQAEFQLPGGGIDPGEHPLQSLHREVYEETGWRIGPARRIGVHRRFVYMPEYDLWAEKICTIYLARPTCRLGPPTEAGHSAVWMPLILAADLVASTGDAAALRRLAGQG